MAGGYNITPSGYISAYKIQRGFFSSGFCKVVKINVGQVFSKNRLISGAKSFYLYFFANYRETFMGSPLSIIFE